MAFSFQPFFPQALKTAVLQYQGTSTSNLVQGGTNGTKVESISVTNTDTIDHAILISMNVSGTLYAVANVNIPANTGNVSVATLALLSNTAFSYLPLDVNGNRYMYLANAACALTVSANSANGTGKVLNFVVQAGDF
jgi:hypothetical protein